MKAKTKLIMSIMSVCLVCAVFAIGVFALRTANLKIGGDVSFNATGVEADIKNATLTGATTNDQVLATGSINTTMTQTDIDSTFQNWQTLELDFNENADDIELKFEIANTSTNANNYIEIDYDYSFTSSDPNVDVFPGDENAQGVWENNNYILAPKGATPAAGDYETFTLKFKVLDKELNVPDNTKVNLTIKLKHVTPVNATGVWNFVPNEPNAGEATLKRTKSEQAYTVPENWNKILEIPSVITDGTNNYIVTKLYSAGGPEAEPSYYCFVPSETTQVVLPNSIKQIQGCFANEQATGLTSIELPKSLTSIEQEAFYGCRVLTSIYIPSSVTLIGMRAFAGCTGLTSITIPNSVTSIKASAFDSCRVLTSITIPSSVTSIGNYAFRSCGLTSITIASSVTSIGTGAFLSCTGLTSITIPSSLTSIEQEAFYGCTGLTSITIPSSVTRIGNYAFYNCTKLSTAKFENPNGWYIATSADAEGGTDVTTLTADFSEANANVLKGLLSQYLLRKTA